MSSFYKIRLTFLDEFDFGQSSAANKSFLRLPFKFLEDYRIKALTPEARWVLITLVYKHASLSLDTFFCRRGDFVLSSKTPLSVILKSLSDLKLIEIIDDTVPVKSREEKNRVEYTTTKTALDKPSKNTANEGTESQVIKKQISQAWKTWNETLATFQIPFTSISPPEESAIARAIKHLGFENVILALEGVRYQKPSKDFNPKSFLSVDRALHRDKKGIARWQEFKNLALVYRSKTVTADDLTSQAKGKLS